MAILFSKDLITAKKELPPVGLDLIITGLVISLRLLDPYIVMLY